LQLQSDAGIAAPVVVDVQSYLQTEQWYNREKTKAAEQQLNLANTLLANGDPQQARRAFNSAYELSTHDDAFNEDARVQLHNLKLQQALVGLNVRQSAVGGEAAPQANAKLREFRSKKEANYTQQDAKEIIERNTADENAAFMKLAEKLIQQQDAAVSSASALRANIPEQGRVLTFKRSVVVDTWANLNIGLKANAAGAASWGIKFLVLFATALCFVAFGLLARKPANRGV